MRGDGMDAMRTVLGGTRAAIGVGGWVAPDLTARVFGFDPARTNRFVTRLFAAREVALATALLTAGPARLPTAAAVGVVVDSADALAGLDEARRGNVSALTFVSGVLGAMLFAFVGARVAREASAAVGDGD
jgi:hypothetical protein